jgi:hypothetical protein
MVCFEWPDWSHGSEETRKNVQKTLICTLNITGFFGFSRRPPLPEKTPISFSISIVRQHVSFDFFCLRMIGLMKATIEMTLFLMLWLATKIWRETQWLNITERSFRCKCLRVANSIKDFREEVIDTSLIISSDPTPKRMRIRQSIPWEVPDRAIGLPTIENLTHDVQFNDFWPQRLSSR